MTKNWSTEIANFETYGDICSITERNITGTSDGKWIITGAGDGYGSTLVDADTGKAFPQPYAAAPLGRYIGAVVGGTCGTCENDFHIIDPETMQTVASLEPERNGPEIDSNSAHSIFMNAINSPDEATFYDEGRKLAKATGGALHILDVGRGVVERSFPLTDTRSVVHGNIWVDQDGVTAILREDEIGQSENVLRRINLATGAELWRLDDIQSVCTASDTQVSVVANNQLILLNIEDGSQIDYTSEFSNCGEVFGDYSLIDDVTVVKLVDGR
ncbi:hypothetical protein CH304_07135 [Rhodococcus sp. 15-649-1-2]|nr:hypothetical protein [Rhodococcus sp. 15-649-1-2]OZE84930.1 hypothetical protein CH304_07135 [Rhodococcus sp. 15-649-1-2]